MNVVLAICLASLFSAIAGFIIGQATKTGPARRRLKPWEIDQHQRCPACGHAEGKIAFDEGARMIRHTCNVCTATWGEECVVKVADWRKAAPTPEVTQPWG